MEPEPNEIIPADNSDQPSPLFEDFAASPAQEHHAAGSEGLEAVYDVPVKVQAVLGRARMPIGELLHLNSGAVVELGPRDRRAPPGKRRPGPRHLDRRAEPGQPQPVVADVGVQPVAQAEALQLEDGPRGQPVAAGLVPGELGGVDDEDLAPGPGGPGRGGRTGGSGADHDHVRLEMHPTSMLAG